MGIPLRPDPTALRTMQRRSFTRAATALVMTHRRGTQPQDILKSAWRDDDDADVILRAAQSPLTTTGTFPQIQATKVLPMLAPDSASFRLLAMGANLDLTGIATIRIPYIGGAGRPAQPAFIAEGAPIPVANLTTNAATLGPTCKIAIGAAVSMELQSASADTAASVIGQALAISAAQATDAALFSANAATAIAPAGILHGVTAIPSAGGTRAPGVADDLALLAQAISNNGIAIDDLIIVTTASLGTKIRVLAGPHFADAVLTSAYIPAGTVIGVIPQGLAAGYAGIAEIETSTAATVHMEGTTPLPIGTPGSPPTVAAPTLSAFQSGLILIKVRGRCAWCVQPGAVAVVTGAAW
jgi:uncharacterized surface protein with fasciclin (FAS1) repeats